MIKVGHLSAFPKECFVAQFSGKTYADAVSDAEKSDTVFVSYFEQPSHGKSKSQTILVSYIKEENDINPE
jgi:hypothetical protein